MRALFMGTPTFAVPALEALAEHHEVIAVYSRPDSVSGRGGVLRPSPVKEAAIARGIPVLQPTTLRDTAVQSELAALAPDVVVVAAYGLILPPEVLEAPRLGCINIHASLLPRWRGAAPIERAILAGDESAGVSIMRMEEGLDTGPYCMQASLPVGDLTSEELTARLAEIGASALLQALSSIENGTVRWTVQPEDGITYAEKITRADVTIDPQMCVSDALRRIRASKSTAPCRVVIADRPVTLLRATAAGGSVPPVLPGAVASDKASLYLGMADGALALSRLRPDGKAEMDARAWSRGVPQLTSSADVSATWKASE